MNGDSKIYICSLLTVFFIAEKGEIENDKKNKINASGIITPQGADA